MQNDEIDDMLTGSPPDGPSGRGHRPRATLSRSLSEDSDRRSLVGHFGGDRTEPVSSRTDPADRDDSGRDTISDEVAAEILSKTDGAVHFLAAATRAVTHAVSAVAAQVRDAGALLVGALRGRGRPDAESPVAGRRGIHPDAMNRRSPFRSRWWSPRLWS